MGRIIGPDVSFYQDEPGTPQGIDFVKMRGAANFVIIRAGQNLWPDIKFKENWKNAKAAGLPRGSYWFYDSRADPKRQAELWVSLFEGDLGELPLFADFEESYGGPYTGWRNWYDFLERLKALIGRKEIYIYTAYYYWLSNAPNPVTEPENLEYFHQYPLWIANYGVAKPSVPAPWGENEWLFWQFTESEDGKRFGAESQAIDLNYFNGGGEAFTQRFNLPVPEIPHDYPPSSGVTRYRVTASVLNVREGPGTNYTVIGQLQLGEIVERIEANADESWIKVRRDENLSGWCYSRYLLLIESPPEPEPPPEEPPPPEPEPEPPPEPAPDDLAGTKYSVTAVALNVREGPGLEYAAVGLLRQAEIVERIAANADGTWLFIRRSDGLKGWSFSAYLLRMEPEPPPEEPPPAEGAFVSWHRVTPAELEMRASPNAGAAVVGKLLNDDIVGAVGATGDGAWIQIRKFDGLTGWCANSGLSNLGETIPVSLMQRLFNGATYFRKERLTPRRMVTHALAIDMRAEGLKFLVTPPVREGDPPLCSRKTSEFLAQHGLHVAVNGDGYDYLDPSTYDPQKYCAGGGDPVRPYGYAVSRGKSYSSKRTGQPILYLNQRNEITFNKAKGKIYNAISGDRMLVEKGKPVSGLEATRVDPRTAVGLNQNGRWLILVAVDGRETSQGATFAELAELMISFGAYTAMSLDGGGSTTMVIQGADGKPRILNVPTDDNIAGHERAVANHLGIYVRK